jgi:tRNA A-37 threonylcarbamoyl transferase component Bud32
VRCITLHLLCCTGIRRALTYAVSILIMRHEVARSLAHDLIVYCMASDGHHLAVGRAAVSRGQVKISASLHPSQWLPLSAARGAQALGLVALVRLFRATDAQLGYRPDTAAVIDGHTVVSVLGVGGFCTVYCCRPRSDPEVTFVLKTRPYVHNATALRKDIRQHFYTELKVLRAMSKNGPSILVPELTSFQSRDSSWIGLKRVVCRLRDHLHTLKTQEDCEAFWTVLKSDIRAAVRVIHAAGYAHNDMHPGNVAVLTVDGRQRVQIIDFGLATSLQGSHFHRYKGGLPYFHDSIVMNHATREYARPGTAEPLFALVTADQDFASAAYVLYAATMYDRSTGRFNISWEHMVGTELVAERARVMEEDKFEVWRD